MLSNKGNQAQVATYESCDGIYCSPEHEPYQDSTSKTDGEIMLVGGSVGMVTGLILTVVGAHRVPVNVVTHASASRDVEDAPAFSWMPTVGPRGAGVVGQF